LVSGSFLMPKIFVKDSGVWKQVQSLSVKDGSTWKNLNVIYVKDAGVEKQVYPDTIGVTTYSTPGTYSYTVPAGVYSLNVSYPTNTGIQTATLAVTPGQIISSTIGNFGSNSTFGTVTAPAYSYTVAGFGGNVDGVLVNLWGMASTGGSSYSGSGGNGTLTAGAAAAGCYYTEISEGYHGDLSASISIFSVVTSSVLYAVQAVLTSVGGRGSVGIGQQPSSSNGYVTQVNIGDSYPDEGSYSYNIVFQQITGISITPTNSYARA
jgi:hypothetical protein